MSGLRARGVALPGRLAATDLALAPATSTSLVGPNGAGKTSLLHALAGIGRPEGTVEVGGHDLSLVPARRRASLLGYVPAAREIAWPLRVRDFVALTAPAAPPAQVDVMLASLSLDDLADRRADRLSTGERSRVIVARALLPGPAALLLDEPFANLDPWWRIALAERLRAEAARGMTILVSVHDLDLAASLGERMLVVDEGRLVGDAAPDQLEQDGIIERVFGVERDPQAGWRQRSG